MGLRALAASMVLMGHYFMVLYPYAQPPGALAHALYTSLRSCPWAGVWVFFTLSGYLMAKGFALGRYDVTPRGVYRFYRNRWLRILPVYVGALLFVSALVQPMLFHPSHWWQLVEMMIFDYRGDLPFNPIGALWSVSTEVQFYFLVPFLFLLLSWVRRKTGAAFPIAVACVLLLGVAYRGKVLELSHQHFAVPITWYQFGYSPLLPNLDLFLAGMSLSFFQVPATSKARRPVMLGWMLVGLAALLYFGTAKAVSLLIDGNQVERFWHYMPLLTCTAALAYLAVAELRGRIPLQSGVRHVAFTAITRTGVLTYCLYVLHPQFMDTFRATLKPPSPSTLEAHSSLLYFPLVMLIVFGVATFFYEFVERPFESRKHVSGTPLTDAP